MTRPHTDDRASHKLPVTGEVGSEGGSYADPTMQVATFSDEAESLPTVDQPARDSHAYAIRAEAPETIDPDPSTAMHRHASEPPPLREDTGSRRGSGLNWRAAAAGAAGAALAMAVRRFRRRS